MEGPKKEFRSLCTRVRALRTLIASTASAGILPMGKRVKKISQA